MRKRRDHNGFGTVVRSTLDTIKRPILEVTHRADIERSAGGIKVCDEQVMCSNSRQ